MANKLLNFIGGLGGIWAQYKLAKDRNDRLDRLAGKLPTEPAMTGNSLGGETGLWDRLKAGNIDEPGSEAYNRWGQGKVDGDASELLRESRRGSPTTPDAVAAPGLVTLEQPAGAPAAMQASLASAQAAQRAAAEGAAPDPHEATHGEVSAEEWRKLDTAENPANADMSSLPEMYPQ